MNSRRVNTNHLAKSIVIVSLVICIVAPIVYMATSGIDDCCQNTFDPYVETNCSGCKVNVAETWKIVDWETYDLVYDSTVTTTVKWRDGHDVRFNKEYVLRVQFNTALEQGDMIVIYGRWNTIPSIKNASIYLPDGTKVGGGEVKPQWKYYYLIITEPITPTTTFDIVIDGGNPSNQKIYIDQVKCLQPPEEENWHDCETGVVIYDYSFNFNYIVTADSSVDPSEVYIDLVVQQEMKDTITDVLIFETMIEQSLIHVPSLGVSHFYSTHVIPMIPRSLAGTDNVTVSIDVQATVKGKILGSDDWIVLNEIFLDVREFTACWY